MCLSGSVLLSWVKRAGSIRNAMLTHKTTPLPESFAGTTLRRRTTARRGFTAQGPCRGKALSRRIEDVSSAQHRDWHAFGKNIE